MSNFIPQKTLPREYYASTTVFEQEMEHIFQAKWICIGRAEQIPNPGDYFLQPVGQENLIIIRGQDGRIRAFYNVCRHRGTRMCTAEAGHFKGSIQCPYHAWTYGFDGRLIGVPDGHDFEGLHKADYPLFEAALETWEGFLFLNLADKPEPFDRLFAPITDRFKDWQMDQLKSARRIDYDIQANWKLIVENYNECYHCPVIHPALNELTHYRNGDNELTTGPFLGGYQEFTNGNSTMSLNGHTCAPPLAGVSGQDLNRVYYFTIFPNMLLSLHPDYVMFHTLWPQDLGQTHVICEWLFAPEAMAAPDFDASPAVEFWDMTNRQDWHVCELSQLGVVSKAYQPGPFYMWHEALLAEFDRQVMQALGKGD